MYRAYVQRACDQALLPASLQLKGLGWPTGCHFLCSSSSQSPIPEVLGFLRSHYLSRSVIGLKRSPRSLEAGTYDLNDYYDFLDKYSLQALQVGLNEIENYLNSMHLNNSPVTGKPFSSSTIRRRASTVCAFYKWADECGLTKQKIDSKALTALAREERRYETAGDRIQKPRAQRQDAKVRFIPIEKLRAILEAAGNLKIEVRDDDDVGSDRLRLMFECGLQAGLRRAEISALEVHSVIKASNIVESRQINDKGPIELLRKGGRYRTVMLPVWLIRNLKHYIQNERRKAMHCRALMYPELPDHDFVFVDENEGSKKVGSALARRYLSGPMRQIQIKLGIAAGQSSNVLYGVHALRHTYALMEYFARKSCGDSEPWLYVQAQLGHKNLATTTDIYLALAAEYECEFGVLLKEGLRQVKGNG